MGLGTSFSSSKESRRSSSPPLVTETDIVSALPDCCAFKRAIPFRNSSISWRSSLLDLASSPMTDSYGGKCSPYRLFGQQTNQHVSSRAMVEVKILALFV